MDSEAPQGFEPGFPCFPGICATRSIILHRMTQLVALNRALYTSRPQRRLVHLAKMAADTKETICSSKHLFVISHGSQDDENKAVA